MLLAILLIATSALVIVLAYVWSMKRLAHSQMMEMKELLQSHQVQQKEIDQVFSGVHTGRINPNVPRNRR